MCALGKILEIAPFKMIASKSLLLCGLDIRSATDSDDESGHASLRLCASFDHMHRSKCKSQLRLRLQHIAP